MNSPKKFHHRDAGRRKGFTIVELTLAMSLSMLVAAGCLMTLGLHTSFMKEMTAFRFLRDEAPQVNALIAQIVEKSVSYRIYATPDDAFAATSGVNIAGEAVRLQFRNPNGLIEQSVIAFETVGGEGRLNYYRYRNGSWPASADWTITSGIQDAEFADDTGVLLISLVGPYNEEITYAGTHPIRATVSPVPGFFPGNPNL